MIRPGSSISKAQFSNKLASVGLTNNRVSFEVDVLS
jgi:hypothetical protein